MTEDHDTRLARLRRTTEALRARPGFDARILGALEREGASGWLLHVLRPARIVMPVVVMAAALALICAARAGREVDRALAESYDRVELEW